MKTIKFHTFGCKVNQYETQLLREELLALGLKEVTGDAASDIYLINTCTVTHKADADSLRSLAKVKQENPSACRFVTGCLVGLDSQKIRAVDKDAVLIPNRDKGLALSRVKAILRIPSKQGRKASGITSFKGHTRAFLKIQDGCDHFCSYCKVPLVRGRSKSKPLQAILQEAKALAGNGYKEIVLSGICLGDYGKDLRSSLDLVDVISSLEKIDGIEWIRLSSIELNDVTDALVDTMRHSSKLCHHLHIPLQSGDDFILKKMNRHYTGDFFIKRVRSFKRLIKDLAITTDVLVGFPGEDDKQFLNTVAAIKAIAPLKVHIFPYSRREHTSAARSREQVAPLAIKGRMRILRQVSNESTAGFLKRFIGSKLDGLIEGRSKEKKGYWEGYTGNYIRVFVRSKKELKNSLVHVILNDHSGVATVIE